MSWSVEREERAREGTAGLYEGCLCTVCAVGMGSGTCSSVVGDGSGTMGATKARSGGGVRSTVFPYGMRLLHPPIGMSSRDEKNIQGHMEYRHPHPPIPATPSSIRAKWAQQKMLQIKLFLPICQEREEVMQFTTLFCQKRDAMDQP